MPSWIKTALSGSLAILAAGSALILARHRAPAPTAPISLQHATPVSPASPMAPSPPPQRDTPRWLRAVLIVELVSAAAYLFWTATQVPLSITRSELSATLVSDALLVFLIVIAIDGFDRRSITREQRWLMVWIARPTVVLMMVALLANATMPVPPVLDGTGVRVPSSDGADLVSVFFSVGWALVLFAFLTSLTLVCVIALSRLARHAAPDR